MGYNYNLFLNGQSVNSVAEAKKIILSKPIGFKGIITKVCDSKHRRNPGKTITFTYKKVQIIKVCEVCGCIRNIKNVVKKNIVENIIYKNTEQCSNPICEKYKQYFEKENLIFGKCISDNCNRTSLKDQFCPIHGGPDIFSDIKNLNYVEYARWVKESEYPILSKLRFIDGSENWLIKDLSYEFPKYLEPMSYLSNWEEGNMTQIEMETLFKMERERNG